MFYYYKIYYKFGFGDHWESINFTNKTQIVSYSLYIELFMSSLKDDNGIYNT